MAGKLMLAIGSSPCGSLHRAAWASSYMVAGFQEQESQENQEEVESPFITSLQIQGEGTRPPQVHLNPVWGDQGSLSGEASSQAETSFFFSVLVTFLFHGTSASSTLSVLEIMKEGKYNN